MRVDLPGGWAELCDPEDVPERKRQPLMDLMFRAGVLHDGEDRDEKFTEDDVEVVRLMMQVDYVVIAALVTEWSFDLPITPDGVMDLPGRAYKVLKELCAGKQEALLPDFKPNPAPDSPTVASPE